LIISAGELTGLKADVIGKDVDRRGSYSVFKYSMRITISNAIKTFRIRLIGVIRG